MSNESAVQSEIMLHLGRRPDVRVFRNHNIKLQDKFGRWHACGLMPGSADIVGIQRVVITPEMVGQTVGVWVSVEVKAPGARTKPEQLKAQVNWRDFILQWGGKAGFASSCAEAENIVQ